MVDVVGALVDTWPPLVVLALAGLLLLVEPATVAGVLLPGTTTLLALGWWSAGAGVPLVVVVGVATVATTSGALLGWRAGVRHGRGDGRHSVPAVVLATGHWASAGRSVLPRLAGRSGVGIAVAAPTLLASGAAWATTGVLLGRLVGPGAASRLTVAPLVVLALVVVVAVVVGRRSSAHGSGGARAEAGRPAPWWAVLVGGGSSVRSLLRGLGGRHLEARRCRLPVGAEVAWAVSGPSGGAPAR